MSLSADPSSAIGGVDLDTAEHVFKALASERRLQILEWLKDPTAHFPAQEHGDPIEHGACNQFIVDKLGISQPAGSRHLKILADAGLVIPTRRKGWTYYRRDEAALAAVASTTHSI
ncbi:MAG: winged helix-turn-helix transcriptional regulator [Actinomycetia bacterium]|nr:winged helix-turn-helix transcriptional regulator [Actinomycetes bacterium]MCP4961522.1 winged helix-turn-helix transcriptional regulator [Actinomycetes bacterium]